MARINNPTLHCKCCIASEIHPSSHMLLFNPLPQRWGGGRKLPICHSEFVLTGKTQSTPQSRVCDFIPSSLFHLANCLSFVFSWGICEVKRLLFKKRWWKRKKKTESGEADRLGDSDMMTGEKSKPSRIRLSAFTALTYSGLFETPCFLLITSSLLLPQLLNISLLKVMIQDFQSLFTHSLFLCYLSIYTPSICVTPHLCPSFTYYLLFKSFRQQAQLLRWSGVSDAKS